MTRLSATATTTGPATGTATWPSYQPEDHGVGIVHLGLGNFARAHLLAYTDSALAQAGGDWRVTGVSLRGTAVAETLTPQNGRYTLIRRGAQTDAQVIGALANVLAGPEVGAQALAAMVAPGCRIVSLTVTEKGYGITSDGRLDLAHPAVAADLKAPDAPSGVIGLIVVALGARRAAGLGPFTVLSCDNLSHNGAKLRAAVLEFADIAHGSGLTAWISDHVTFPSTMVDRITPASTALTTTTAATLTGFQDLAAVETEPFTQWVVEDDFCAGRPAWEKTGVLFTADVAPYEQMKLRMLNGAHSMLAYSGQLAGRAYVRDVMANPDHARLVHRHLSAAASTVTGLQIDLVAYAAALVERFENPSIAHATAQIAMDGTQKLPQRITAPALEAAAAGKPLRPFIFALACWIAYVARQDDSGQALPVDDPKAAALLAAVSGGQTPAATVKALAATCPDILPPQLATGAIGASLADLLTTIRTRGIDSVIAREAESAR